MKYEDTVMEQHQRHKTDEDTINRWLKAQAEITWDIAFKAGQESGCFAEGWANGIKEVVDWAENNDPNNSFWKSVYWQAQKKEWGV